MCHELLIMSYNFRTIIGTSSVTCVIIYLENVFTYNMSHKDMVQIEHLQ